MTELARLVVPALRWDDAHGFRYVDGLIDDALELGVGGFLVEGGPREETAALIGRLHAESRHPLLIAVRAERGAGETIAGLTELPPLGAIASVAVVRADDTGLPSLDVETVRRAARLTARELRNIGANWALAPVCDVDVAAGNPAIGSRAVSDDPAIVAAVVAAWIDACQAEAVVACARHFHGVRRRDDVAPFAAAIDAGVASVMVAAAGKWRDLLRGELGFDGIAVTTSLDRDDAIAPAQEPALAALAVAAGCDVVLAPGDLHGTCDALARAAAAGAIPAARAREAVGRVERWAGWARPSEAREPTLDDLLWVRQLADRGVRYVRGARPRVGGTIEVVAIVAPATGAPGSVAAAPKLSSFVAVFQSVHVEVTQSAAPTQGERAPLAVVVIPADQLCGTLTDGEVKTAQSAVRSGTAAGRDVVLVACCHPRGAAALAGAAHGAAAVLCVWDASRPMLEAAARAIVTVR